MAPYEEAFCKRRACLAALSALNAPFLFDTVSAVVAPPDPFEMPSDPMIEDYYLDVLQFAFEFALFPAAEARISSPILRYFC